MSPPEHKELKLKDNDPEQKPPAVTERFLLEFARWRYISLIFYE